MEAREWTPMQRLAIDTKDKTLLVSAAAGSGKTATLTERIISQILDPVSPMSISDMLIVTFTKKAAGELRTRISAALSDALAEREGDKWLESQLLILPAARICTIDSFCSEILRANCDRVGVPHGYRILDTAEAELLADGMIDALIDSLYEDGMPEVATAAETEELAKCLTDSGRQGDLAKVLRSIYRKTMDTEDGVGLIRRLARDIDPKEGKPLEECLLVKHAMERTRDIAGHFGMQLSLMLATLSEAGDPKLAERMAVIRGDLEHLSKIREATDYDTVRELVRTPRPDTPRKGAKGCPAPVTAVRKAMNTELASLAKGMLLHGSADYLYTLGELHTMLLILANILEAFHSAFLGEKKRRGALEYADVTRLTYECLWDGDGPTDLGLAQAEQYSAIYVDEYQDVNALQHKIFLAISKPHNRFMVGDIKQSIYCFRSADPFIFSQMKEKYPPIDRAGDGAVASVYMSENFRSDKAIIDYVNLIFDKVFDCMARAISYEESDSLRYAKKQKHGEPPYRKPELCLVPKAKGDEPILVPTADGVRETTAAALTVAAKIKELTEHGTLNNGDKINPSDVAIILRSAKGHDAAFAAALSYMGIKSAVKYHGGFFLSPEILLALSVLYAVDNPRRDVYLAASMTSPVFGFTADELAKIKHGGGLCLYDSLRKYVEEHPDYKKGEEFIERLERYRLISEGVSVDALIARLYQETGLLTVAARNGGRDNLMRLYEYARQFEKSSYRGLYNFLSYIDGVIGRENEFESADAPLDDDAVKIMTAHSSKGLECPVVFYADPEHPFKKKSDTNPRLLFHEFIGAGMKLRTKNGLGLVDNPTKHTVADFLYRMKVEEEARVLYVILTRARERLYIVGSPAGKVENYIERQREQKELGLDSYSVYSASSSLDLIMQTTDRVLEVGEFLTELPEPLRVFLGCGDPCEENAGEDSPEGAESNQDGAERDAAENTEDVKRSAEGGEDITKGTTDEPCEENAGEDSPEGAESNQDGAERDAAENTEDGENGAEGEGAKDDEAFTALLEERFKYVYPHRHLTELPEKLSVSRLYPRVLDEFDGSVQLFEADEYEESKLMFAKKGVLPAFYSGKRSDESTARGIATHLLFQFCDPVRLRDEGAEAELKRLTERRFLSDKEAELVRLDEVELFRRSRLLDDMINAHRLWRELRFNVRLPADEFTEIAERSEAYRGREVLVQGVIDCIIEDGEGGLHLIDYKTDRLTKAQLADKELARERLYELHSRQLSYYSAAIGRMFGKPPVTVEVYSLPLGDTVDVKVRPCADTNPDTGV